MSASSLVDADIGQLSSMKKAIDNTSTDKSASDSNSNFDTLPYWNELKLLVLNLLDVRQQRLIFHANRFIAYYNVAFSLFTRRECPGQQLLDDLHAAVVAALCSLAQNYYKLEDLFPMDRAPVTQMLKRDWEEFQIRLVQLKKIFQFVNQPMMQVIGDYQRLEIQDHGKEQFVEIIVKNKYVLMKLGKTLQLDQSQKFTSPTTHFEYQLSNLLGAGWSGLVYSCVRLSDFQEFAVKFCDSADDTSTHRSTRAEFQLNQKITSPYVVRAEDSFNLNPTIRLPDVRGKFRHRQEVVSHEFDVCLILEKCEPTLETRLKRSDNLTHDQKLKLFFEAALGIFEFHQKGLIHRDLKPDNILTGGGTAKISDFDRVKEGAAYASSATSPYAGNRKYASPEKLYLNKYSRKDDVWALGLILAEMFGGSLPLFHDPTPDTSTGEPFTIKHDLIFEYIAKIPGEVGLVVKKCLVASQFRVDVKELLNDGAVKPIFERVMPSISPPPLVK